jgi:hypothetical protein
LQRLAGQSECSKTNSLTNEIEYYDPLARLIVDSETGYSTGASSWVDGLELFAMG